MMTHWERYGQVTEILARHGLGFLATATGVEQWIAGHTGAGKTATANPQRLRRALEELGPVFIKLGQMLSTRPDLLPPEYISELAKLQDGAPALAPDIIRGLISEELGHSPEHLFLAFDDVPLASASIGQAHAATLHDGTSVVVKVRRPGVVAQVNEDLEILQNLATRAERTWTGAANYNVAGVAVDFSTTLRAELDYLQEGRNAERFARNFANEPDIHIPAIFWQRTTSRVLTIERIRGIKVDQLQALNEAGLDRHELANRAARAAAKMVFVDGFFHADPHPGNLFVESNGSIGLIDFGMVGEVSKQLREQLGRLLMALTSNDAARVSSALLALSTNTRTADRSALREDTARFIQLYQGKNLGQIAIAPLVTSMLSILRTHHLQLPREMAMIVKMLLMTEGLGARLDPTFSLGEVLKPYAKHLALERFAPRNVATVLAQLGLTAADLSTGLPEKLDRLVGRMEDGLEVHLRATELEPLVSRAEVIGNRLVAGMIAAAFIRGIGDLTTADQDRLKSWLRPLLAGGVGAVGALGAYLALTGRPWRRGGPRR